MVISLHAFGGDGPKNSGPLRRSDRGSEVSKWRETSILLHSNLLNFLSNRDL